MDLLATYYSSSSSSSAAAAGGIFAGLMAFFGAIWLFAMAMVVISIIANWKIFTKAGREGWKSIIPIYNNWVLFEIAGMNGALSLLLFVPVANVVMMIIMYINLAKVFGKDTGFAVGLILLSFIFILILAFGKDKYLGESYATILAEHKGAAPASGAAPAAGAAPTQAPTDPWVNGNDSQTPTQPQA